MVNVRGVRHFPSLPRVVLAALVAIPMAFNAVALAPEVLYPVPNVNDDAEHLVIVRRVSEALTDGENPLDPWVPQLDLGYPQLATYQMLPHVAVVAIHRAFLGLLPLRTVFDLVRYLLLVTFPLTVLWSMRTMGFTANAAAMAAAAGSLISGGSRYGFEYDSYVWRGFGLFTQIFGMHLAFVTFALLQRLLRVGTGVMRTGCAVAALVLSHLIFAYMLAIGGAILGLAIVRRSTIADRARRIAVAIVVAAALSAFFVVPFFSQSPYLNVDPYLERAKYDSFGAPTILGWLATGDLLDHGRVPIFTTLFMLGLGIALIRRDRIALPVIAAGATLLVLYFGRPTIGPVADMLPLHDGLLLHRFIGGFELAAIPLIGFGGAWVLERVATVAPRRSTIAVTAAALLLLLPALGERWSYYAENTSWLRQTSEALASDADARRIVDRIATGRPGRAYAGLRSNWGASLNFDLPFNSVRFYNLFADRGIDAIAPPYRGASLNADLVFDFNDQDLAWYDAFNVDYVVAPHGIALPGPLTVLLDTPRYVLYVAPGSGYARYAAIGDQERLRTQSELFAAERAFMQGTGPALGRYRRFDYERAGSQAAYRGATPDCAVGSVGNERISAGRMEFVARCDNASALVLKVTYHPNWEVTADGVPVPTFMASPSFIGVDLPAGRHLVVAEYRSPLAKGLLFWSALVSLVAFAIWRTRLTGMRLLHIRAWLASRNRTAFLEPKRRRSC